MNTNTSTPISKAVEPMKAQAMKWADEGARAYVETIRAKLAAADFDLTVVAPHPHGNMSRRDYMTRKNYRAGISAMCDHDAARMGARSYEQRVSHHGPEYVTMSDARIARFIEQSIKEAAASYEGYVAKLNEKVGAHTAATMTVEGTWSYSMIKVTKADGSTENWKTQMIVNVSVLGKLFNQWPTRKVK